jgi:hypothetical protein
VAGWQGGSGQVRGDRRQEGVSYKSDIMRLREAKRGRERREIREAYSIDRYRETHPASPDSRMVSVSIQPLTETKFTKRGVKKWSRDTYKSIRVYRYNSIQTYRHKDRGEGERGCVVSISVGVMGL